MSHRRAKLTVAGRKLLIERILEQGWAVPVAAEAQGVSAATAYKWVRRFRTEGAAGLLDRSSRPHRCPHRLAPQREAAIVELRRRGRVGPHRIAWALGESQSTVYSVLRRHGMPRLAHLDRPSGVPVRYERDHPGELVHIDIKRQGRIPDGGGWWIDGYKSARGMHQSYVHRATKKTRLGYDHLHIAVDDRSRIAYVEVHPDELRRTAEAFTERAIAYFAELGVEVQRVMTDNGSCYRGPYTRFLESRGVRHVRTRPYRPQTNGKVERFNRTLVDEWAYAHKYSSEAARRRRLDSWLHTYNHHRCHTALGGQPPITRVDNLTGHYI